MRKPIVSIIIPAYNEEEVIERLLLSINAQSYPNIECIVVDDASTDSTPDIAKALATKVYSRKHFERSVQRNFGASKANGDYLLFLDADMALTKNVVAQCIYVMQRDGSIGAVAIPEESVAKNFWEKVKAYERSFYNEKGDSLTDAARFFSKKAFKEVKGYDESITGPEDWDLPERVLANGYKIARVKAKILHYERVSSPLGLARKKYYYALTSYRYLKKHNISPVSAKTIYFLRPVFYQNWKRIIAHPVLGISMILVFCMELVGGGLGYTVGRIKKL
ncbi:glycosyltransferase [Candidatus Microgenomates bacterium]|nr:MAG: glycosyltransferase [Candidatus Microgenomates bacterium]